METIEVWVIIEVEALQQVCEWKFDGGLTLIKSLHDGNENPWLVCGDFNKILTNGERYGGQLREFHYMFNFCISLLDCNLEDLGYTNPKHTSTNRQSKAANILEDWTSS